MNFAVFKSNYFVVHLRTAASASFSTIRCISSQPTDNENVTDGKNDAEPNRKFPRAFDDEAYDEILNHLN